MQRRTGSRGSIQLNPMNAGAVTIDDEKSVVVGDDLNILDALSVAHKNEPSVLGGDDRGSQFNMEVCDDGAVPNFDDDHEQKRALQKSQVADSVSPFYSTIQASKTPT